MTHELRDNGDLVLHRGPTDEPIAKFQAGAGFNEQTFFVGPYLAVLDDPIRPGGPHPLDVVSTQLRRPDVEAIRDWCIAELEAASETPTHRTDAGEPKETQHG